MRKLLLLLPLILATPVLADSDPFGLNRDAYRRFSQHFVDFYQFASVQDWEMACSELRMANLLRFPLQASSTQMRNITLTELICGPAVLGIGR